MDPVASVAIGQKSVSGRLAFYVAVQLTSVVIPGAVLIGEVAVAIVHANHPGRVYSYIVGQASKIQGAGNPLFLFVLFAGSYVAGYVAREVGFRFLGSVEKLRPSFLEPSGRQLKDRLFAEFGAAAVVSCLQLHPTLDQLLEKALTSPSSPNRLAGGGHQPTEIHAIFTYCKSWLKEYAPGLGVEDAEVEINILVSTFLPTLMLILVCGVVLDTAPGPLTLLCLAALGALMVTVGSAVRMRKTERWQSVHNLLQDYVMRKAAVQYPNIQSSSTGPGTPPGL